MFLKHHQRIPTVVAVSLPKPLGDFLQSLQFCTLLCVTPMYGPHCLYLSFSLFSCLADFLVNHFLRHWVVSLESWCCPLPHQCPDRWFQLLDGLWCPVAGFFSAHTDPAEHKFLPSVIINHIFEVSEILSILFMLQFSQYIGQIRSVKPLGRWSDWDRILGRGYPAQKDLLFLLVAHVREVSGNQTEPEMRMMSLRRNQAICRI